MNRITLQLQHMKKKTLATIAVYLVKYEISIIIIIIIIIIIT